MLRLVDAEADPGEKPGFIAKLPPAEFASPLEVKEVGVEVPPLLFPGPGVYTWQVVWDGKVIHERCLVVALVGGQARAGTGDAQAAWSGQPARQPRDRTRSRRRGAPAPPPIGRRS